MIFQNPLAWLGLIAIAIPVLAQKIQTAGGAVEPVAF